MKWKIPKNCKIGGQWFKIAYDPELERRHGKLGQVDISQGRIWIAPEQSDESKMITLVHECLHILGTAFTGTPWAEANIASLDTGITILLQDLEVEFDWSGIE